MPTDSESLIFAKLSELESEIATLRSGYLVVNKRYSDALSAMKTLTSNSLEAAVRAALAAEKATQACKNAMNAAVAAAS